MRTCTVYPEGIPDEIDFDNCDSCEPIIKPKNMNRICRECGRSENTDRYSRESTEENYQTQHLYYERFGTHYLEVSEPGKEKPMTYIDFRNKYYICTYCNNDINDNLAWEDYLEQRDREDDFFKQSDEEMEDWSIDDRG